MREGFLPADPQPLLADLTPLELLSPQGSEHTLGHPGEPSVLSLGSDHPGACGKPSHVFFFTCLLMESSTLMAAWGRNSSREGTGMGEMPLWHVGNPVSQESIPTLPSSCNANSCYIITCQISLLALQGVQQTLLPFLFYLQRAQPVCFPLALSAATQISTGEAFPTSDFLKTGQNRTDGTFSKSYCLRPGDVSAASLAFPAG